MNTLNYLITTAFDLYIMVVLLRFWLQLVRADFYNPFSQFVVKATNPVIVPLRRIIPGLAGIDLSSLLFAFALIVAKMALLKAIAGTFSMSLLTLMLLKGLLGLVKQFGALIFWVLIIRAILSWVSQGRSPVEYVLSQLTEPMMTPIRRVIPPLGGLDLSLLVIIIIMNLLNSLMYDVLPGIWPDL